MKKELLWVLISCAMVAILVLAACAPAPLANPTAAISSKTTAATSSPKTSAGTTEPLSEQLQYGGTLNLIDSNPSGLDPAHSFSILNPTKGYTNSDLMTGDWAKGPAGTDLTDWQAGFLNHVSWMTGSLAESWEMPDDTTIIYHLRHGVHFYVQPGNAASELVGGRELTADDVVWSENREWTAPKSTVYNWWTPEQRPTSFKALDKYTVEVKVPSFNQGNDLFLTGGCVSIYAPEVVAKYGSYDDWRNQVGTGPFWIKDFVSNSQITYERNPNYFEQDPLHPQNQLPYVSKVNQFIITDHSTQLAALRTGKIDISGQLADPLNWEDKAQLSSTPQLQFKQIATSSALLWGREDNPDLPFSKLLVRQAMNLAIDQPGIVNDYYKGNADIEGWPFPPYSSWSDLYIPLDQMPSKPTVDGSQASVQELFQYHPNKAKQLLAGAGYPNGFKFQVVCLSSDGDFLSILKDQFSKVGIDMEISPLETGAFRSESLLRKYDQAIFSANPVNAYPTMMMATRLESANNFAFFHSSVTDAAYAQESPYVGRDDAKWASIIKGVTPYILEESVGVWLPMPWAYRAWWPWVKNYHGEGQIGYCGDTTAYTWYVALDQSLKKSMGY